MQKSQEELRKSQNFLALRTMKILAVFLQYSHYAKCMPTLSSKFSSSLKKPSIKLIWYVDLQIINMQFTLLSPIYQTIPKQNKWGESIGKTDMRKSKKMR